jgi:hypothetical protein
MLGVPANISEDIVNMVAQNVPTERVPHLLFPLPHKLFLRNRKTVCLLLSIGTTRW